MSIQGITVSAFLQQGRAAVNDFIGGEMENIKGATCPVIDAANDVGIAIDNARNA